MKKKQFEKFKDTKMDILKVFLFSGDHSTGVWVGGSDNGHVGKWAWFPTGE